MSNPFSNTSQVNAVIRIRRGPDVDRNNITPETGEIIYTTDSKRMFVGDGSEYGGYVIGNKTWIVDDFNNLPRIEKNDCVYLSTQNKFFVLTGDSQQTESNYVLVGGRGLLPPLPPSYVLPVAQKTVLGGIKTGVALSADSFGTLDVKYDSSRITILNDSLSIPLATASTVGVAKFGTGLNVDPSGMVTVAGAIGGGGSGSGPSLSLSKNYIVGNGGSLYTLTNYADNDADNYLVFVNGVEMVPFAAYTITTPNIVFASNIPTGANIVVYSTIKCGQFIPKPTTSLSGEVLSYDGTDWISKTLPNFILNPGGTNGQFLVHNGTDWIASTQTVTTSSDFTGSNQSLATNGYQKLPGGLILQWGVVAFSSGSDKVTITGNFPISFPNSVFGLYANPEHNYNTGSGVMFGAVRSFTNSGFVVYVAERELTSYSGGNLYWYAVGN